MRKSLVFFILLAAVIIRSGGLSRAERRRGRAPEDDRQEHLNVGGVDRTYFLHIPRSLAEGASAPLVLVFHGGGGHAANMAHFTHFDELADREGFLVAYPESFNKSWNDTRGLSPADDVGFIRMLIADLERSRRADPKRIYATGISNGGFFSNRLACDLTDTLAAIASVAATMPQTLVPLCKPSAPISVMFMHGTQDPLVHIDGGPVLRDRGVAVSLAEAQDFWRKWDGTTSTPVVGSHRRRHRRAARGVRRRQAQYGSDRVHHRRRRSHLARRCAVPPRVPGGKSQSQSRCHGNNLGLLQEAPPVDDCGS
jgi:poly(3-hydroxybutyrate) depolymerase